MDARPLCPTCRYNLSNLTVPRCPECGRVFSAEEWADTPLLAPMPAWERRPYVSAAYALPATIWRLLSHPGRFFRGLRAGEGLLGAGGFFWLLIPATWILAAVLFATMAGIEYSYLKRSNRITNLLAWEYVQAIRVMVHVTGFLLTILACWMPALVGLDLAFWRQRRPFRLFAKALLYNMTWAGVVAAVAATIVNALLSRVDMEWTWLSSGRHFNSFGVLPWIGWTALAAVTCQCVVLSRFARSPSCAFRLEGPRAVRMTRLAIGATWLLALYLMMIDRHVHLRFYLLFIDNQIWSTYRLPLGRP